MVYNKWIKKQKVFVCISIKKELKRAYFTFLSNFDGVDQNLDLNFTFTENPNEYTSEGSYDIVLDFTVNGISETETTSIDNLQEEGTWERNENILSINGEIIDLGIDVPVAIQWVWVILHFFNWQSVSVSTVIVFARQ